MVMGMNLSLKSGLELNGYYVADGKPVQGFANLRMMVVQPLDVGSIADA